MKRFLLVLLFLVTLTVAVPVSAQSPTPLECGRRIQADISNDGETHTYTVELEQNSRLLVEAGVLSGDQAGDLRIEIGVTAPDGTTLDRVLWNEASTYRQYYRQQSFFVSGIFTITVRGYIQFGGNYWLNVDCVDSDGDVIGSSGRLYTASCGDLIENRFNWNQDIHRYYIQLERDNFFNASAEITDTLRQPTLEIGFLSPTNGTLDSLLWNEAHSIRVVQNQLLNSTGLHTIVVQGYGSGGGNYSLAIGCTQGGEEIPAGSGESITITRGEYIRFEDGGLVSGDSDDTDPVPTETAIVVSETDNFYGFPGIGSVNFDGGVEIPLTLGQPQNAPVGGDIVALYTIDATAGQVSTLTLSRVSGELSIGVAVINSSTNDIIFFGGMPSSDNLSVELTFPEAGSYAIGLFALDTATSGAVQVTLE